MYYLNLKQVFRCGINGITKFPPKLYVHFFLEDHLFPKAAEQDRLNYLPKSLKKYPHFLLVSSNDVILLASLN